VTSVQKLSRLLAVVLVADGLTAIAWGRLDFATFFL